MRTMKTGFIGAGNMGSAIIGGLVKKTGVRTEELRFFDVSEEKKHRISTEFSLECAGSALELALWAELIVIAVKPKDLMQALRDIRSGLTPSKLIVSVAAGIDTNTIESEIGVKAPVVRAMPNTPVLIGLGMTVLCGGARAEENHLKQAEALFAASGETIRVSEELMDAVTAVSGSGPAYLFYLAEAMLESAEAQGLSRQIAVKLVRQTIYGAAGMLAKDEEEAAALRRRVTSPGGTTESAIKTLEDANFKGLIKEAVKNAAARSFEIRQNTSTSEQGCGKKL